MDFLPGVDPRPQAHQLLANLQRDRGRLVAVAATADGHAGTDLMYRFYHHSFKVYGLQDLTGQMVAALEGIAPDGTELHPTFQAIVTAGTGRSWTAEVNRRWVAETRPMVDAFLHARWFVGQAISNASLDAPPQLLPSGWAALLYLYGLR